VPADQNDLNALFGEHGLAPFLQSTSTLVVLISAGGQLLAWNPAFDSIKKALHDTAHLRDFLSLSSRTLFDLLLSTVTHDRIRTQGELDLGQGNRLGNYTCFLYPVPDGRILFVAEPSHAASELEALTEQLQKTRQTLERKETELQAVLAQAQEVSTIDALTALPNRRQVLAELQEAVAFSAQYGTPLTILLLDIDYFKILNDTHGHAVGDEVLRRLADALRHFIHPPETVGRCGGEEFLVLLPHHTLKSATEQAERLCRQVRAMNVAASGLPLSITVSIGIAEFRGQGDWQALFDRAERALLQAKQNGRDRWLAAENE
jgi:diguanylate cyclase